MVATCLGEELRAAGNLRIVEVSHGGHGKSLGVEHDLGKAVVRYFRTAAVGGCPAFGLCLRAIIVGKQGRSYTHVAQESAGGLLLHRRLVGLPAEPSQG